MTREICEYLKKNSSVSFSVEVATELARFHDDSEILAGDILSVRKAQFTPQEKADYEKKSLEAINTLSEKYSDETSFDYKKLLLQEHNKNGIEYHIVMYADKLDAHMEVCHEIFAGSSLFLQPLTQWGVDMNTYEHTKIKSLKLLQKLEEMFQIPLIGKSPLFHINQEIDIEGIHSLWIPYTKESITEEKGYDIYDSWKKLHFRYWNTREKEYLYIQKEFT